MSSQALNYVISLLARREYSEFEIRCKMQEKHFSEQEIDEVLAYCQQKNWQNDQRFTENYLIFRAQRGYGFSRIKQELQQLKGINSVVIQQALNEAEVNWSELAFNLLRKKFPDFATISDLKIKQKIWRYMLSHGFRPEDFSDYIGSGIEE
ncbi:MAG: recombination regulator RecX [Pasteurella oralis]|uniref:recombination regulator RecX n=1 Tax=Pasteurella oralis TaxID=1071947 RepID=UPI00270B2F38|nr:recombination regulator RecX [Pasteurella oralis]